MSLCAAATACRSYDSDMAKRISTEAYQALRDALAVVTWFRRAFESLVTTSLRDNPELVAGLNFSSDTKTRLAVIMSGNGGQYVFHDPIVTQPHPDHRSLRSRPGFFQRRAKE